MHIIPGSNSYRVLAARYLNKDKEGNIIETPEERFYKVAEHVASNEQDSKKWTSIFHELMIGNYFLPNTPCLANAGKNNGLGLSACFFLDIEDNMDSILETLVTAARIFKNAGGCGYAWDKLRPSGTRLRSSVGEASGPIPFIKMFNEMTLAINQGGIRRGANMGVMSVHHTDIQEFIDLKKRSIEVAEELKAKGVDETIINDVMHAIGLTQFNFSVGVTDVFMKAVEDDTVFDIGHELTGTKQIKAISVFNQIAEMAHASGCPGVIFLDRVNKDNLFYPEKIIRGTNPCGETPLLDGEACALASINLTKFFDPSCNLNFNITKFKDVVHHVVRFLDNMIDVDVFPAKRIKDAVEYSRKIGVGVMGYADLLTMNNIPYGNSDDLTNKIIDAYKLYTEEASLELAEEKGLPKCAKDVIRITEKPFLKRNTMLRVVAPTGSLSMIVDVSPSVEPLVSAYYTKTVLNGNVFVYENTYAKKFCETYGLNWEEFKTKGSFSVDNEHTMTFHDIFKPSDQIPYEKHINVQALWQDKVDGAISKTISMPHDCSVDDFKNAYMLAYEKGCKGVTAFRLGGTKKGVYSEHTNNDDKQTSIIKVENVQSTKRPNKIEGSTEVVDTSQGKLYITTNFVDKKPFEVFLNCGKSGYEGSGKNEAIGRLISLALRNGIPLNKIIKQLDGISGGTRIPSEHGWVLSIPDAVAKVLRTINKDDLEESIVQYQDKEAVCPNCYSNLMFNPSGGCPKCPRCGVMCS